MNGENQLRDVIWTDQSISFQERYVEKFIPFRHGAVVFGGYFGDEGKGKEVDIIATKYKKQGFKLLSVRGQGSGNAGHTVVVDGKKYDFHYLTSAGLVADIMLLGPGMLLDPIRVLEEAKKLPIEKQNAIRIAERATIVTDIDRFMDTWCESARRESGMAVIGTTKSGVGPVAGNRGYRFHVTFADALRCKNSSELKNLLLENPLYPNVVKELCTEDYVEKLWKAIHKLNIVSSEELISMARLEGNWAILLEVSQAVALDPLFGNGGHYVTSTPCTDIGGAAFAGLTMKDFPDGSIMVLKAYGSKVGGGPYITRFTPEEEHIATFIDQLVGERGVTTGRKRSLGWFDGPAVRHAIALTGAEICVNCLDVIVNLVEVTDEVKVCFAYRNKKTGEVTYNWPYYLDEYEPLYVTMPLVRKNPNEIVANYIWLIEKVIGKKIQGYGVGPGRDGYRERREAFIRNRKL